VNSMTVVVVNRSSARARGFDQARLKKDESAYPETPLMRQALALASRGYQVLPCLSSKAPACARGLQDASNEPQVVRPLFSARQAALVGVRTGSVSGVAVLDIDPPHGTAWLADHDHRLPATVRVRTRRGGVHLWYAVGEEQRTPTTAGRIGLGVDTRGDGGYAIAWSPELLFDRRDLAAWPRWLGEAARPHRSVLPPPVTARHHGRYETAALLGAIRRVAAAPEGSRNDLLNREVYALARLPGLARRTIAEAMTVAAREAGLDPHEIEATIASALSARAGAK
jgi:hypothetical protein